MNIVRTAVELHIDIKRLRAPALPPCKQVSVSYRAVRLCTCFAALQHIQLQLGFRKKKNKQNSEAAELNPKFINKSLKFTH